MCDTCHRAKQKRLCFPLSSSRTNRCFELLHMDIWGPLFVSSMYGHKYFLTIVDDFSRFTWLIPMVTKSETKTHIENFIAYVKNQFESNVKIIHTDNGQEFAMKSFFSSKGIIHQTTCVETPEQNGVAERKHQHILNVTRPLIFQANLPPIFWNFATLHVFFINCTLTPLLENKSPYEKLHAKSYDLTALRVFGCLCYSSTITSNRRSFDARAVSGVFLGFWPHTKGYFF